MIVITVGVKQYLILVSICISLLVNPRLSLIFITVIQFNFQTLALKAIKKSMRKRGH